MKVKFCGIRRKEDLEALGQEFPDYLGFILCPSPRQVTAEAVREMMAPFRGKALAVGVFQNQPLEEVTEAALQAGLDVIQLHGQEDSDFILALQEKTGLPVWKAIPAREEELAAASALPADCLLVDSPGGGGKGRTADWNLIRRYEGGFLQPYFLAGGLHAGNLREALELLSPAGVDMSSGIEKDGRKDPVLMKTILDILDKRDRKEEKMERKFGPFGGQYVPETLMEALHEVEKAYESLKGDPSFQEELQRLYREVAGRPSLLYFASRMTEDLGGARIWLKREDLNHTGSHKINNVLGQILLARRMGKKRIICETGAGQHGVATATACALFGMPCRVYMGAEDVERQGLNVFRMELMGAEVIPVQSGTRTLKDAVSEAFREWTRECKETYYLMGSVVGPHPFPTIVRDFQKVIGEEAREQILAAEGRLPDKVLACVGGGSNAIGIFHSFLQDEGVELIGVEAGGEGLDTLRHAATMAGGSMGVFHGMKSIFLQDSFGKIMPVYSLSAGMDYPGIGPEHAWLAESGRARYLPVTDEEAVEAFTYLSRMEGIIPAIESAHAIALAMKMAPEMGKEEILLINLSGRGDKDVDQVARWKGVKIHGTSH